MKRNLSSWIFTMSILSFFSILSLLVLFSFSSSSMFLVNSPFFKTLILLNMNNLIFIGVVLVISLSVFSWALYYMKSGMSMSFFFINLFLFVSSMLILVLSDNLFIVFIGWEGLGITSFLLIVFYQNWMSLKGGVLTLLTNRIGDAVLMIIFSYWIIIPSVGSLAHVSSLMILIFIVLTFTKSAQVPFTSWLPAAMAAPTPVSALVHSSTLVTAGVWLMIRFGCSIFLSSSLWLSFGLITLFVASSAALIELDSKKVVALSTLSQLGLMYLALALGGVFICLFHLLMHALAKANLFLMVGNLIHSRFSQQDFRYMNAGNSPLLYFFMMIVSVLSLSGVFFSSGFFSKDIILMGSFAVMTSSLSFMIIFSIITMTFVYCMKIIYLLSKSSLYQQIVSSESNILAFTPSLILTSLSMFSGYFYLMNHNLFYLWKMCLSGLFWVYFLYILILLSLTTFMWGDLFKSQSLFIYALTFSFLKSSKQMTLKSSSTLIESFYLMTSFNPQIFSYLFMEGFVILMVFSLFNFMFYKM